MAQTTENSRILLRVRRFLQHGQECGIAAVSSIANYYDPSIEYADVRRMVCRRIRQTGMYTPQQGILLNKLGFTKVTIVARDLVLFDYSWNRLTNKGILSRLVKAKKYLRGRGYYDQYRIAESYIKWLSDSYCENRIRIDNDFTSYIKRSIRNGRPVCVGVNVTSMYKWAKGSMSSNRDITGEADYHALVIRGFDDDGVFVVDSDNYRNRNGFYKLKWTKFLANTDGDLLLVG